MRLAIAKKPKILELKKEIALLIDKKLNKCESFYAKYFRSPKGYYWTGYYHFENKIIRIYWQNYVQDFRRGRVNYITISWDGQNELTKKELLYIKDKLFK